MYLLPRAGGRGREAVTGSEYDVSFGQGKGGHKNILKLGGGGGDREHTKNHRIAHLKG